MKIEDLTSTLEERGVVWQGGGFALIGAVSLTLIWVYSEADRWSIGIYRLTVTQLSWAFVVSIAIAIEGVRKMFETRTEIRRRARERFIANAVEQARKKGRDETENSLKSVLRKYDIEIPPEAERELFPNGRDRKWWPWNRR